MRPETPDRWSRPRVPKLWGHEEIVENNPLYCCKLLWLKTGYQSSLHYHKIKDETFLCLRGQVALEVRNDAGQVTIHRLNGNSRSSFRLLPGVPHRFWALQRGSVIVETSTPHSDEDVYRLEESCKQ